MTAPTPAEVSAAKDVLERAAGQLHAEREREVAERFAPHHARYVSVNDACFGAAPALAVWSPMVQRHRPVPANHGYPECASCRVYDGDREDWPCDEWPLIETAIRSLRGGL